MSVDPPLNDGASPGAEEILTARINLVRERFLAALDGRLAELAALARLSASDDYNQAEEAWTSLMRGLHTLAGTAPTLGLVKLGEAARDLERKAARVERSGGSVSSSDAAALASDVLLLGRVG